MKICDRFGPDLAAFVYSDLPPEETRALETHLESCEGCREELRGLQRAALSLSAAETFARESEVDWDAFATATVNRARGFRAADALSRGPGRIPGVGAWIDQIRRAPGWAAAAAGLLLLAGVAVGAFGALSLRPAREIPMAMVGAGMPAGEIVPALLPQSMLDDMEAFSARAGTKRYLADSRAMLVSLLGSPIRCSKDDVDIRDERTRSLQLIRRQRLLAEELQQLPLSRAQDVCRDLERLLLEIASLNDCARAEQILELRELVQKRQLLLRIDLLADEMARSAPTDA